MWRVERNSYVTIRPRHSTSSTTAAYIAVFPSGFATLQPLYMASRYTVTLLYLFKASFRMGLPLVTSCFSSGLSFLWTHDTHTHMYMCALRAIYEYEYTKRRNKSLGRRRNYSSRIAVALVCTFRHILHDASVNFLTRYASSSSKYLKLDVFSLVMKYHLTTIDLSISWESTVPADLLLLMSI